MYKRRRSGNHSGGAGVGRLNHYSEAKCTADTCSNPRVARYLEELSNDATAADNLRANARKAFQSVLKYPPIIRNKDDALEMYVRTLDITTPKTKRCHST